MEGIKTEVNVHKVTTPIDRLANEIPLADLPTILSPLELSQCVFDHVGLPVADVPKAARSCEQLLGAEIESLDELFASITIGKLGLNLVLQGRHPVHIAWRLLRRPGPRFFARARRHRDGSYGMYASVEGLFVEFIWFEPETAS